jgi:Ala-tRNA(Pro) deacylase
LFSALTQLGIDCANHHHAPVMTVEDNRALRGVIPGLHSKNLFLKDKSSGLWLVVAEEQQSIDLKALGRVLQVGKFSFANAETLLTVLGVPPGSVTPFAIINDPEHRVRVVLDQSLARALQVNFHPLTNTQTTTLRGSDLVTFLQAFEHDPLLINFTALDAPSSS